MFNSCSLKNGVKTKLLATAFFTAVFALPGHAQDDDKPSALVTYGEDHPYVFIGGIMIAVLIAVFAVYFLFMRTGKKKSSSSFSKQVSTKTGSNTRSSADRRYAGRRHVATQGGFTRK